MLRVFAFVAVFLVWFDFVCLFFKCVRMGGGGGGGRKAKKKNGQYSSDNDQFSSKLYLCARKIPYSRFPNVAF